MLKEDYEYCWQEEDFEETVASALIACYENKIINNRIGHRKDRLTTEYLARVRKRGPYIPSNSRCFYINLEKDGSLSETQNFDMKNDVLPERGVHADRAKDCPRILEMYKDSYMYLSSFEKADKMGKHWTKKIPGLLYSVTILIAQNKGISGERWFVTVSKDGIISSCIPRMPNNLGYRPGVKFEYLTERPEWFLDRTFIAAHSINAMADKRFCWTITAQEAEAKAHLGCMKEEIKSLLYARTLPLTTTGRKRPILHLVEAHRRRIKSGIDIDITSFLRGQQTVEIGGTLFTVNPPKVLKPHVSEPSQEKYFHAEPEGVTT